MAGEDQDGVKIDPKNVGGVEYNAIPEEKHQALEAHLKELEAEAKRRLVACYGKTRQSSVKKEQFVMPTFPSSATNNVSISSLDVFDRFASIIGDKIADSNKCTNDLLRNLFDRVRILVKGKGVDHRYSTETLNPHRLNMHLHLNCYMVRHRTILLGKCHHRHWSSQT